MKFDDFDRMMRRHELEFDQFVPEGVHTVARLDGRGFTKLTKEKLDFDRPFDSRFNDSMRATCEHLMSSGFPTTLCYTQSDEISLLLDRDVLPFGGKVRKFVSVLAGEASGAFSLSVGTPVCFDCRLCPLPQAEDVVDYFRWRAEDARRNALNAHCYWMLRADGLSPRDADKKLSGLAVSTKLRFLGDRGVDFDRLPEWQTRGLYAHWRTEPHSGYDPVTGETTSVERTRLIWLENTPTGKEIGTLVKSVMQPAPVPSETP